MCRAFSSRIIRPLSSHTHTHQFAAKLAKFLKFIVFLFCSRLFICHFFDAFISLTARCFCVLFSFFFLPFCLFFFFFFFLLVAFLLEFYLLCDASRYKFKAYAQWAQIPRVLPPPLYLCSSFAGQFVSICLSLFLHTHIRKYNFYIFVACAVLNQSLKSVKSHSCCCCCFFLLNSIKNIFTMVALSFAVVVVVVVTLARVYCHALSPLPSPHHACFADGSARTPLVM